MAHEGPSRSEKDDLQGEAMHPDWNWGDIDKDVHDEARKVLDKGGNATLSNGVGISTTVDKDSGMASHITHKLPDGTFQTKSFGNNSIGAAADHASRLPKEKQMAKGPHQELDDTWHEVGKNNEDERLFAHPSGDRAFESNEDKHVYKESQYGGSDSMAKRMTPVQHTVEGTAGERVDAAEHVREAKDIADKVMATPTQDLLDHGAGEHEQIEAHMAHASSLLPVDHPAQKHLLAARTEAAKDGDDGKIADHIEKAAAAIKKPWADA
jgi:hypothetical protein